MNLAHPILWLPVVLAVALRPVCFRTAPRFHVSRKGRKSRLGPDEAGQVIETLRTLAESAEGA